MRLRERGREALICATTTRISTAKSLHHYRHTTIGTQKSVITLTTEISLSHIIASVHRRMYSSNANSSAARPPSPPTMDDAELLRSVATSVATTTPPRPVVSSTTTSTTASTSSAKNNIINNNTMAVVSSSSAVQSSSAAANNTPSSPPSHPPTIRPIDHTYTNYSIICDSELQILDIDAETNGQLSLLKSASASPEEEEARAKLQGMICSYGPSTKNCGGVTKPFPWTVRCLFVWYADWLYHHAYSHTVFCSFFISQTTA